MENSSELNAYIQRVRDGEVDAFAEIVRVYQSPVRAWIVSRSPPGVDVDEIAQKSFVAAFTRIGEYEIGTDFRAWLFSITRYQLMAECTRMKRLADYHSRYVPHALSMELERRAEFDEVPRLAELRDCLGNVAAKQREVLDWRYKWNLSIGEIAAKTNRSVGAIKKQLFVLRQKLHECIQAKIVGEAS